MNFTKRDTSSQNLNISVAMFARGSDWKSIYSISITENIISIDMKWTNLIKSKWPPTYQIYSLSVHILSALTVHTWKKQAVNRLNYVYLCVFIWLFGQCKIVWPSKWAEQSSAAHEKTVILIDRRISEDDAQPLLAVNHNSMLQSLDSIVHRALYSVQCTHTQHDLFNFSTIYRHNLRWFLLCTFKWRMCVVKQALVFIWLEMLVFGIEAGTQ